MADFFISYNKADAKWAEWIAFILEENAYDVILQSWDFLPGTNFVLEMHRASQSADRTIAILSPDYLSSQFTPSEWAAAFKKDPTSRRGRLIPIKVRPCDPEGLLEQIVYIDLVGIAQSEAEDLVLRGISQSRAKPIAKPTYPGDEVFAFQKFFSVQDYLGVTILHLSDFQFGISKDALLHKQLLSSLSQYIRTAKLLNGDPPLVFISGDISYSGKESEFLLAKTNLEDFFKELQVSPISHCYLAPGNHDVDWLLMGPADESIIAQIATEEKIAQILSHPPTMNLLASRLNNFYDFTGKFLGRTREWRKDRPWRVDLHHMLGKCVAIMQINSAWAVGQNSQKPIIGEYQIREALSEAEGANIRLWLIHHGLVSLGEYERTRLLELLSREDGIDLVYSGHLHAVKFSSCLSSHSLVYELSSGPLYPSLVKPSFSVTKIDINSGDIKFNPFQFDGESGSWIASQTDTFPRLGNVFVQKKDKYFSSNIEAKQNAKKSLEQMDVGQAPSDRIPFVSVEEDVLHDLLNNIKSILILTAVRVELEEVLRFLKPLPKKKGILRVHIGQETYYVGKFGAEVAVVTLCGSGAIGRDSVVLSTADALRRFNIVAIIMVGIAFGKDRDSQKIGDVLVATQIIPYENLRVGDERSIFRGTISQTGPVLLNRFRQALDWNFKDKNNDFISVRFGPLLSGEKVIDNSRFSQRLFDEFPQAIGGEMEGAGLYAVAARKDVEWIVVKSICDWADGTKTDNYQDFAAKSSVSLVHHVLSDGTALKALKDE